MIPAAGFAAEAADEASTDADLELQLATELTEFNGGTISAASIVNAGPQTGWTAGDSNIALQSGDLPANNEWAIVPTKITKDDKTLVLNPASIKVQATTGTTIDTTNGDTLHVVYKLSTGAATDATPSAPGTYTVWLQDKTQAMVNSGTPTTFKSESITFTITSGELDNAQIYAGTDTAYANAISTENPLVYGMASGAYTLSVYDPVAKAAVTPDATAYYQSDGKVLSNAPTTVGNYYVKVTKGTESKEFAYSIAPLDLSKAVITMKAVSAAAATQPLSAIASITANGQTIDVATLIAASPAEIAMYNQNSAVQLAAGDLATAQSLPVQIKPTADATDASGVAQIINYANVTVDVVTTPVANGFFYGSTQFKSNVGGTAALPSTTAPVAGKWQPISSGSSAGATAVSYNYAIDLSKPKTALDLANFGAGVVESSGSYTDTATSINPDIPVTVTIKDSKTGATVSDLSKPGEYTLSVSIDSNKLAEATADSDDPIANNAIGGTSLPLNVTVYDGKVADTAIAVRYKGNIVGENTLTAAGAITYDGTNQAANFTYTVTSGTTTLVEGTDYTVEITKNSKVVTEMVNQGTYKITIKGTGNYDFPTSNNFLNVAINPIKFKSVEADGLTNLGTKEADVMKNYAYPYTGSAITPTIAYNTKVAQAAATPESSGWSTLPTNIYALGNITYYGKGNAGYTAASNTTYTPSAGTSVNEVKEIGWYTVQYVVNDPYQNYQADTAVNAPASFIYFQVAKKTAFQDVNAGDWFEPYVENAVDQGYMNGVGDTGLFLPNNPITRADIATVLYRMAGGVTNDPTTGEVYPAKFSDPFADVTNSGDYFFNPVGWAKEAGITTGVGGSDDFMPFINIPREQFATMMMRYAKATNQYAAPEKSTEEILADFEDASSVSDWARDAVAWCISEGMIQGVGGQKIIAPANNVSRAEVAKITTVFQPEKINAIN